MKKFFINYGDENFKKQQRFSLNMARILGGFDRAIGYSFKGMDLAFRQENAHILKESRGGGFWLWKPYFILKTLNNVSDGDYIFYCDSGAFFIKNVDVLINELNASGQDIMGFELPLIEKQWTKKELFESLGVNSDEYKETNQVLASFILIKKTDFSLNFFRQYLLCCQKSKNITDYYDSDICQDDSFIDHRHDQSIFSLLYKKNKLKVFKDPSQLGGNPLHYANCTDFKYDNNKLYFLENKRMVCIKKYNENYSDVILHYRRGKPVKIFFKYILKKLRRKLSFSKL